MAQTAAYFGLTIEDLCGSSRSRVLVTARQIAMYLCRELTDLSLPKIGQQFGGRDHTTVMHADRKIRAADGRAPRDLQPGHRADQPDQAAVRAEVGHGLLQRLLPRGRPRGRRSPRCGSSRARTAARTGAGSRAAPAAAARPLPSAVTAPLGMPCTRLGARPQIRATSSADLLNRARGRRLGTCQAVPQERSSVREHRGQSARRRARRSRCAATSARPMTSNTGRPRSVGAMTIELSRLWAPTPGPT